MRQAEAYQTGESRHREAQAAAEEAGFLAQAKAAEAEAKKIEAEKRAQLEASAKAVKAQTIVDAQAAAEKRRIEAQGEADAIFAKLDAEARGNFEILAKKGQGLREIVESCGGAQAAFQMLMLEHMGELSENAARAISNIKFDKVIVWENGDQNGDGHNGTTGFLRNLAGSLPPMLQIMKDIGGVEMPEYFGRLMPDAPGAAKASEASNGKEDEPAADEAAGEGHEVAPRPPHPPGKSPKQKPGAAS